MLKLAIIKEPYLTLPVAPVSCLRFPFTWTKNSLFSGRLQRSFSLSMWFWCKSKKLTSKSVRVKTSSRSLANSLRVLFFGIVMIVFSIPAVKYLRLSFIFKYSAFSSNILMLIGFKKEPMLFRFSDLECIKLCEKFCSIKRSFSFRRFLKLKTIFFTAFNRWIFLLYCNIKHNHFLNGNKAKIFVKL